MSEPTRLVLHGAPPDTANLGVTALFESVVAGLFRRLPDLDLTVFDNGYGTRPGVLPVDGEDRTFRRMGCRTSRRYYRPDTMRTMDVMSRLGGVGNPGVGAMKRADAILDLSGGDSFTDLYGPKRFDCVAMPKAMAIRLGRPLVLLPQTYGPFQGTPYRIAAARLVGAAEVTWARDERSYEVLQDLLGDRFDPSRHRVGVDVAFGLTPRDPGDRLQPSARRALEEAERPVGFNISGLIHGDPVRAREQYGFVADYRQAVMSVLEGLLDDPGATLFLVPHVRVGQMAWDSDPAACREVHDRLAERFPGRVVLVDDDLEPGEIKWVIGRTHWFCGTRMHSTIAGLSSGVPTASIAYSDKTRGVFETCGRGRDVIDPRVLDTEAVVAGVLESYGRASGDRPALGEALSTVKSRAEEQLDAIVSRIVGR